MIFLLLKVTEEPLENIEIALSEANKIGYPINAKSSFWWWWKRNASY